MCNHVLIVVGRTERNTQACATQHINILFKSHY